jgi:hypothetical protein
VSTVPAVLIARELTVGGVRSTVDELVVIVRDVSEMASLPTRSWIAEFAVVLSLVGAV